MSNIILAIAQNIGFRMMEYLVENILKHMHPKRREAWCLEQRSKFHITSTDL